MFLFARTRKSNTAEMPSSLYQSMVKEQAGLTVVELLIAATILVFVLAGAYTFFSFGWSSFDRGTDRAVVQNNLRMAAEEITKEVRFAEGISIIDASDVPDPVVDDDTYLFVNNDNRIERKNSDGSKIIPHELDSNVFIELDFERSSSNVLKVVIMETGSNMTLETEILILNIPDGSSIENSSGNTIRIGSNGGGGGGPGTIPVISDMIIDPDQHITGSAQIVNVIINTQGVNDGTEITLDFLDTDATTVLYSANAIINNDSASTLFNLPESLPAGSYILRASGADIPNDYDANYTINGIISTLEFINTDNPPNATVNSIYAGHSFSATGGVTPYTYNITEGSLPTGMSMNADGMLEGTPTLDDTYNFTVTVNDSSNPMESTSHEFILVVHAGSGGEPVNLATDSNKFSGTNTQMGNVANLSVSDGFAQWNTLPCYVQYDLGAGNEAEVISYTLKAEMSGRAPQVWTMQGSNNGETWDVLSTVTLAPAPNPWISPNTHTFDVPEPSRGSYRYYRLTFDESYHNNLLRLNQVQLIGLLSP